MELGISTLPFFGRPTLEDAISDCLRYGFRNIEIMCEAPQANPEEITAQRRRELVRLAEKENIQYFVHAPIADINLMSLNAGIRAEAQRQLIETVRFTRDINAKRMVFHIGGKPYMGLYNMEEGYKNCILALEDVVTAAETYGVTLLMENDPNKFGLGAIAIEDCERILNAYAGRLYFLLDVGHAFMLGDSYTDQFCRKFGSILKGAHFSDNHRERDEHLGLGRGEMNVGETVESLKRVQFAEEIILEVKNESDIIDSANYLKSLI